MKLPTDLNEWNYDTIYALVTQHDAEPGAYDFKGILNGTGSSTEKEKLNESIRHTVCSMANTDGGYIIFGVKDATRHPHLTPEQLIAGIPKSPEYLKQFGDKIASIQRSVPCIYPDTLIDLPDKSECGILVVYVPLSPLRPHMLNGIFYRRANTGKAEQMNWHEVRDQMLYTEGRLQKVRLLRLKIAQFKMLREMQLKSGYEWENELAQYLRYEITEFESLIADICDLIPPQSNLLQKLLDLSKTATIINTVRDRNNHFTEKSRHIIFSQESNLLADFCEKCEKELSRLFDSL